MVPKKAITTILVVIFLAALIGCNYKTGKDQIPNGWFKAGSKPASYEIGILKKEGKNGERRMRSRHR